MRAAVPFGEHRWDEVAASSSIIPGATVHMMTTPARSPDHTPGCAKGQEEQKDREQQTEETKTKPKEWKWPIWHAIVRDWRLPGGRSLKIHNRTARQTGIKRKAGDTRDSSQQHKRSQNAKNNISRHYYSPFGMLISSEI
jgi:hypothetical protein